MSVFKEMKTEDVLRAIEGHKDILTPEAERLEALYRSKKCPRCEGDMSKEFDAKHAFADPNATIGRALLRCRTCGCLLDPFTDIILESVNPQRAEK